MIYKKVAKGSIELKFESDDNRRRTAETVGFGGENLQAEADAPDHGGGGGAKEVGPWGAVKEVRGGVCHGEVGSDMVWKSLEYGVSVCV